MTAKDIDLANKAAIATQEIADLKQVVSTHETQAKQLKVFG